MSKLAKLKKRGEIMEGKRNSIVSTFQVCREAMQKNTITHSQRQIIRDILRPVLKKVEEEILLNRHKINNEYLKLEGKDHD